MPRMPASEHTQGLALLVLVQADDARGLAEAQVTLRAQLAPRAVPHRGQLLHQLLRLAQPHLGLMRAMRLPRMESLPKVDGGDDTAQREGANVEQQQPASHHTLLRRRRKHAHANRTPHSTHHSKAFVHLPHRRLREASQ